MEERQYSLVVAMQYHPGAAPVLQDLTSGRSPEAASGDLPEAKHSGYQSCAG